MTPHTVFSRIVLWLAVGSLFLAVVLVLIGIPQKPEQNTPVTDFTTCKAAGFPIMESNPEQCRTSDGKVFIDNKQNASNDDNEYPGIAAPPLIVISSPAEGAYVANPTTIKGYARGSWFFEASFPVEIKDGVNNIVAVGQATAEAEWMTEEYVPFTTQLSWKQKPSTPNGVIIAHKDNPSGLPENDASVELPISFIPISGVTRINVFFPNPDLGSAEDCRAVFPLPRDIQATTSIAQAALRELLMGPREVELTRGYITAIPSQTRLLNIAIQNTTATANFSSGLSSGVAGSCMVGAIGAQITETLRQFPSIKNGVIAVEGETEGILEP